MRILDEKIDTSIDTVTILLTLDEANELIDGLSDLINTTKTDSHVHVSNHDFSKEITIALYNDNNINSFSERYRKLIKEDK